MSTYYITKYAATKGILTITNPDLIDQINGLGENTGVLFVRGQGAEKFFVDGKDAFESLDDARKDAIKRTRRKVTALFKKEGKLEAQISRWEEEIDGVV